jgi:hypothetical protein
MTQDSSRSLEWSVRLYRLLLRAYPASFRRRYACEMAEVFGDMAEAAVERRGGVGLIGLWVRVLPDLMLTAVGQQLAETERRVAMWRQFLGRAHFLAAFTVALFLAALATPADPASMVIAAVPIFGVYVVALTSKGLGPRRRSLAILAGLLHAVLWVRMLYVPAPLVFGPEGVQSATRVVLLGPAVIVAGLPLLATLTTALIVGLVALMSGGRKQAGRSGPNEDAEIVA